jgi:hypothetical protein
MYIRCPTCGRRGHLPDKWIPDAHSLRCRKCRANFSMPELTRLAAGRKAGPTFEPVAVRAGSQEPAAFLADGFFSGFDDPTESPRRLGPGDSNYELTFTLGDPGDSRTDWDAQREDLAPEAPSSDEIEAVVPTIAAPTGPEPWHRRFIESWGLVLIGAALALVAIAIPVIGYLFWRTFGGGPSLNLPAPTLIAGFVCAVPLLMISVPLILLAACLTELVRDIHRLRDHLERMAGVGHGAALGRDQGGR